MNKILYFITSIVIALASFSSCLPDNSQQWEDYLEELERQRKIVHEQYLADSTLISNYLIENDTLATWDKESGLFYNILEPGSDQKPNINSLIEFKYKGSLTDGFVFSESENGETVFSVLGELIGGWQIGIPKIGAEGHIILYLPSYLGYGTKEMPNIPANSVLIFEVELIGFF
jgi:FKBP-type peptidyl-prolyl cis-trans isomerase FkpA